MSVKNGFSQLRPRSNVKIIDNEADLNALLSTGLLQASTRKLFLEPFVIDIVLFSCSSLIVEISDELPAAVSH